MKTSDDHLQNYDEMLIVLSKDMREEGFITECTLRKKLKGEGTEGHLSATKADFSFIC